jgi:hypothetical protein
MYWFQRIVSWPIRVVARITGYWEPSVEFDFVAGTYTDDKIWPFRRDVKEVLTITGNAQLTAEGLRVEGEGSQAFVTWQSNKRLPDGELKRRTE